MHLYPSSGHLVGHAQVFCFGPGREYFNWSLNRLQTQADLVPPDHINLFVRLARVARDLTIETIYAPRVADFNARLATSSDYPHVIMMGEWPLRLHRGAPAAGMEIPKGTGLFVPTADCPTVIVTNPVSKRVIAAHAGLKELVDVDYILTGKASRENGSVVSAMVNCFPKEERWGLIVKSVCGIGPACYTHPTDHQTYGEQNKKMLAYLKSHLGRSCVCNAETDGRINLHGIIRSQAMSEGVHFEHISDDLVDTYCDVVPGTTLYQWHSHRRAVDEEKPEEALKRNGVLVINPD